MPRKLTAAAHFEAGQAHEFELVRRRTRTRAGQVQSGEGRSRLRVEVVGMRRGGAQLACTYLDPGAPEAPPLQRALQELVRGLRFSYRTSVHGRFRGLLDLRGLRRQLRPLVNRLSADLPEMLREALQATFEDETFAAHCARDLPLLHGAYGLSCAPGGETLRPVTLQSPLGGAPMEATERIRCQQDGHHSWSVERFFDPESLRRSLLEQLTAMATRIGTPAPTAGDVQEVVIVDRSTFELEQPGGWPLSIRFEREAYFTAKGETGGQGETIEILRLG